MVDRSDHATVSTALPSDVSLHEDVTQVSAMGISRLSPKKRVSFDPSMIGSQTAPGSPCPLLEAPPPPLLAPIRLEHLQTQTNRAARSPDSPSSLSSLERRACRICQSETGDMVRPCGCAGTMGDIHENCLSQWVSMSANRSRCEICHENYAKSGWVLKPLKEWSKPSVNGSDFMSFVTLAGLIYSIVYLILLMQERLFYQRWVIEQLPIRSDDLARIFIFVAMMILSGGMLALYVSQVKAYVNKQRTIRFVNKYKRGCTKSGSGV